MTNKESFDNLMVWSTQFVKTRERALASQCKQTKKRRKTTAAAAAALLVPTESTKREGEEEDKEIIMRNESENKDQVEKDQSEVVQTSLSRFFQTKQAVHLRCCPLCCRRYLSLCSARKQTMKKICR